MRRTSIELDEALLTQVQELLGTHGVKDTVERAFREVIRTETRKRLARRIKTGEGIDRVESVMSVTRPRR